MILEALFLFFTSRWVENNTNEKEKKEIEHEVRSKAAKKGWETRRKNEE